MEIDTSLKRNQNLDILKFICSFFVVLIHVWTPYSHYYHSLIRCAVPCFFMISGYLIACKSDIDESLKKNCRKIVNLLVGATLLYIPFFIFDQLTYQQYKPLTGQSIIDFLLFNEHPWGYHLWYFAAYVYVLVFARFIMKLNTSNLFYFIAPTLLIVGVMLGRYQSFLHLTIDQNFYTRNFLFEGIPCFLLGFSIKKNNWRITINKLILCALLTLLIAFIELFVIPQNRVVSSDLYIYTYILAFLLTISAISFPSMKENLWSKIGKKYSLYIYVIHYGLINLVLYILSFLPSIINKIYTYLAPIVIYLLSLILSMIYVEMKNRRLVYSKS